MLHAAIAVALVTLFPAGIMPHTSERQEHERTFEGSVIQDTSAISFAQAAQPSGSAQTAVSRELGLRRETANVTDMPHEGCRQQRALQIEALLDGLHLGILTG